MRQLAPIAALAAALSLALPAVAQEAMQNRLTVTGTGTVASAPDMAVITLGVTSQAEAAADAMRETNASTTSILALLTEAGIAAGDVQTSDLTLMPIWSNRSPDSGPEGERITGFRATNTVTVRVRDLNGLGQVLDDVLEAGANTFQNLRFALQDPEPALNEARRRAVTDAMARARLYADAAGLTLGPVLEFTESGGNGPIMMREAMAAAAPVAGGEVDTEASVTMVFTITGP